MISRRGFFGALSTLPFVKKLAPIDVAVQPAPLPNAHPWVYVPSGQVTTEVADLVQILEEHKKNEVQYPIEYK